MDPTVSSAPTRSGKKGARTTSTAKSVKSIAWRGRSMIEDKETELDVVNTLVAIDEIKYKDTKDLAN
eukprot:5954882-Ditylum_brightwellii.AAC.1